MLPSTLHLTSPALAALAVNMAGSTALFLMESWETHRGHRGTAWQAQLNCAQSSDKRFSESWPVASRICASQPRRTRASRTAGYTAISLMRLRQRPGLEIGSKIPIMAEGNKYVDVVITRHQERLLVELKVFVTNYGRAGRPVTDQRDAIRLDLMALSQRLDEHTDTCVVWLAYPIPSEREAEWTVNHLRPIQRFSGGTVLLGAPINIGQAYARAYLSEAPK